jgi:hypothetical protein
MVRTDVRIKQFQQIVNKAYRLKQMENIGPCLELITKALGFSRQHVTNDECGF